MRVCVTGATGFVGRALVRRLLAEKLEVTALVRSSSSETIAGAQMKSFELNGEPIAPAVLEGANVVVHLAAFLPSSYAESSHARTCLEVNALGTLALVTAAIAANVDHFVYMSSGNAYTPRERAVVESDAMYPASRATYYLASKIAGELYATHAGAGAGVPVTVLRPSAIYGAGMKGGLVPTLAKRLLSGGSVILNDGGSYRVDLVHVDDVVEATLAAMKTKTHGPFNIGSGATHTTLDVARTLAILLKVDDAKITFAESSTGAVDLGFSALDISRAKNELGFHPRGLREGLESYLASLV